MRLICFQRQGRPALGVRRGEQAIDLGAVAPELPRDWPAIFAEDALDEVRALCERAPDSAFVDMAALELLPPVPRPPKVLCVGLNYRAHAAESGIEAPETPIFFVRFPTSLVGHGGALVRPRASDQFDYEGELAAVVGRGGRHIAAGRALDHVAGYSLFNDGSLRDFQFRGKQWTLGKNFDSTGGFGPEIVTPDELPAGAAGLRVETHLNGERVQDGHTDDLIFDVAHLIAAASEAMTLEPGDVFVTGTPPGVGMARTPPLWMKPGDVCTVSVEGIGSLTNPVVAEEDTG